MNYVFDPSFVAALILPDEKDIKMSNLYKKINNDDRKYTPQLFWYEIANVFKNLLRRNRYTPEQVLLFFPKVSAFCLSTDFETGINYSKKLWELCNKYNLSSYDAAYLELADRKKAVLCTLDENLIKAAKTLGVTTIH